MISKKITFEDVRVITEGFLNKAKQYDFVIGVGRGGSFIAILISNHQTVPFVYYTPNTEKSFTESISQVDLEKIDEILNSPYNQQIRVLIVTDIISTGRTISSILHEFLKFIAEYQLSINIKIDIFSLHGNIEVVNSLRKMFKTDNVKITFGKPKENKQLIYPWEKETN